MKLPPLRGEDARQARNLIAISLLRARTFGPSNRETARQCGAGIRLGREALAALRREGRERRR